MITNGEYNLEAVASLVLALGSVVLSAPLAAQERKPQAALEGHTDTVESLSFSPDSKTLASGGRDSIKLWDVKTGRNTATLKDGDPYFWETIAFSRDGKTLASGGRNHKVKLWDVDTLKGTLLLDQKRQCAGPWVMFSPDGKTLASGVPCHGYMRLFDVPSGKTGAELLTAEESYPVYLLAMAITPDGKTLIGTCYPNEIMRWDLATGKYAGNQKIAGEFPNWCAAFSTDAKVLATVVTAGLPDRFARKDIKLWDVTTGKARATLQGHESDVRALAFSADDGNLGSGSEDGTIKLWDVTRGKELASFKGHSARVECLAFSPDGKLLASGSEDKMIKLWNVTKVK
jgi:WD40 repeat protein